jgi:anthranilate/para-aminobenzoate synthase component II
MIYICDFEDSFTYNILSQLKLLGLNCKVIEHKNVYGFLESVQSFKSKTVVILGPGPGHPDEYQHFLNPIRDLLEHKQIYVMGICLGHQLLLKSFGFEIAHCLKPLHGETRTYQLPREWVEILKMEEIEVQLYNSLTVVDKKQREIQTFSKNQEIIMSRSDNFISYQFHPESIGTSCPERFFGSLRDFLYNE